MFNQVLVHLGKNLFSIKIGMMHAVIIKICDILVQNQEFLKLHELALKIDLNIPFTTYYGLVNAIPT